MLLHPDAEETTRGRGGIGSGLHGFPRFQVGAGFKDHFVIPRVVVWDDRRVAFRGIVCRLDRIRDDFGRTIVVAEEPHRILLAVRTAQSGVHVTPGLSIQSDVAVLRKGSFRPAVQVTRRFGPYHFQFAHWFLILVFIIHGSAGSRGGGGARSACMQPLRHKRRPLPPPGPPEEQGSPRA